MSEQQRYVFAMYTRRGEYWLTDIPMTRENTIKSVKRVHEAAFGKLFHAGLGFWTRSGVYLGRLVPVEETK